MPSALWAKRFASTTLLSTIETTVPITLSAHSGTSKLAPNLGNSVPDHWPTLRPAAAFNGGDIGMETASELASTPEIEGAACETIELCYASKELWVNKAIELEPTVGGKTNNRQNHDSMSTSLERQTGGRRLNSNAEQLLMAEKKAGPRHRSGGLDCQSDAIEDT